jgi:hypothetical protein
MNIHQAEQEAADYLIDHAMSLVKGYVDHPGDIDAAMTAVLVIALEKLINKEIYIEQLY